MKNLANILLKYYQDMDENNESHIDSCPKFHPLLIFLQRAQ